MTFITHGDRVSVVSDVRERVQDFKITFALYVKKIFEISANQSILLALAAMLNIRLE
jgi:hypothetical protein